MNDNGFGCGGGCLIAAAAIVGFCVIAYAFFRLGQFLFWLY